MCHVRKVSAIRILAVVLSAEQYVVSYTSTMYQGTLIWGASLATSRKYGSEAADTQVHYFCNYFCKWHGSSSSLSSKPNATPETSMRWLFPNCDYEKLYAAMVNK